MATTKFTVAGILVEAIKSVGGGFYEITVVKTGKKYRYLADVFEMVAKPVLETCWKCGATKCDHSPDPAYIIAEAIDNGVIPVTRRKI